MAYRFNVPPGWPVPPDGWTPPEEWKPDPSWPTAPDGWQWWSPMENAGNSTAIANTPADQAAAPEPQPSPGAIAVREPVRSGGLAGIFGGAKKRLEEENDELRRWIAHLTGLDAVSLAAEVNSLKASLGQLNQETVAAQAQLDVIRSSMIRTSVEAELQEVGIYEYQHPLVDAVAYKARLAQLSDQMKVMARANQAVLAAAGWTVNGSAAEGKKMIREYTKLMLRAYNAEADNCVARVQPHRLHTTVDRLTKVAETIARLGKTMGIMVAPAYHQLRLEEIRLTADYRAKVEEEKERVREERERQRDERQAQAEFEREKARLQKEQAHYLAVLAKKQSKGDAVGIEDLQGKLKEIGEAIAGVEAREANIRAGYVYVISNLGAFGPAMVKIGMTRRLEPDDRIRELGDASVPFRFDTHALIFSEDAVGLEARLHSTLAAHRVNKVNLKREFFYATPAKVRDVLQQIAGQHLLEFRETVEALEWRASGGNDHETKAPAAVSQD